MDIMALSEQLLCQPDSIAPVLALLSEAELSQLVEHLKQEADRHWTIDPMQSLERAELIM